MKVLNMLHEEFPHLFYKDMPFYFECDNGWYSILHELMKNISYLPKNEQPRFTQIKEKNGTLKVYTDTYSEIIQKLIMEAELKSSAICEKCGRKGKIRMIRNDYKIMCDSCYKDFTRREGDETL